jgi:hypothetical protein
MKADADAIPMAKKGAANFILEILVWSIYLTSFLIYNKVPGKLSFEYNR